MQGGLIKAVLSCVAGVVSIGLLTGCSPSGGTAAIVNGVVISDRQVSEVSKQCVIPLNEVLGEGAVNPEQMHAQMSWWLVFGEIARQEVESRGEDFAESALKGYLQQAGEEIGLYMTNESCADLLMWVARHDLIAQSKGPRAQEFVSSQEIELNPRYGTWNWMTGPGGSGSLSTLVS